MEHDTQGAYTACSPQEWQEEANEVHAEEQGGSRLQQHKAQHHDGDREFERSLRGAGVSKLVDKRLIYTQGCSCSLAERPHSRCCRGTRLGHTFTPQPQVDAAAWLLPGGLPTRGGPPGR